MKLQFHCAVLCLLALLATQVRAAECPSLYGIHDADPDPSTYLNHIKPAAGCGWVTATVAVGHNPADTSGANFSTLASQGHTVICRINNGYFPNGTIPLAVDYDNFARRCSNFVLATTGCNIWLIGNECNLSGEWPFTGTRFTYVSPQDYATCFRKVYNAIKSVRPNDKVLTQPAAPFAGPYGAGTLNGFPSDPNPLSWTQYLNQMLTALQATGPLDGIALHITSRGYNYADIHSTNQVNAAGQLLYFSFNVYKDWVDFGIPRSLYGLPLYATECNGYYYWKGGHPENPAAHYEAGWMQEIYAEIDRYNQSAGALGKPVYHCVNMYRWCASCDNWNIDGTDNPYRAQILSDLDAAATPNYKWPLNSSRVTLVRAGSVWKYLDNGSNQGTAWRGTNFNDSTWASGPAQLGYGDNDEATVLSFGTDPNNKYITTYFRRSFPVTNAASFTNLTVRLLRDDGGVVYLNGVEIFRSNMTNTPILFDTLAASTVGGVDESFTFYATNVNPNLLVNGTNLLAVEIHQVAVTSSDISFDLELAGAINNPPLVTLTSPTNGAVFGVSTNLALAASATDSDGQVSKVEFFAGNVKLGEDSTSPFTLIWTNASEGSFALTAVATDNGGSRSTSAPVQITLFASLASTGSVWKYLDDGSDQGTAWRGTNFDDSAWASGPAQLGYGDGDEATIVSFGTDPNNKYITTYFRRYFSVCDPVSFTNLLLRLLRDDGAVVYVNGTEVFRSNMPTNDPILFNTLASSDVGGSDESSHFYSTVVSPGLLVAGWNLLAVEVHQVSGVSDDLSFDLELLGLRPPPSPALLAERFNRRGLLSWPAFAQGFQLQSLLSLGQTNWMAVTNTITVTNYRYSVSVLISGGATFFRLKK
jgi:hypothetical protein